MTDTTPDYAGLEALEQAIIGYWGNRCSDFDGNCPCCQSWKQFDALRALLERNAELEARVKELEAERDDWKAQVQRVLDPAYLTEKLNEIGVGDLEARAEATEAKLAEAMKVIGDLLACPSIADEDHSDPEWGCEETADAERAARNFLKENGNGE